MLDANQQWTLPPARRMCGELARLNPLWIEEPTHPDDLTAHVTLAREIAPVKIATGEHIPNRVVFKNFIEAGAMHYVQADCTRLGGVGEFLAVSLLARKNDGFQEQLTTPVSAIPFRSVVSVERYPWTIVLAVSMFLLGLSPRVVWLSE